MDSTIIIYNFFISVGNFIGEIKKIYIDYNPYPT